MEFFLILKKFFSIFSSKKKWKNDISKNVRKFHKKVIIFTSFTQEISNNKHADSKPNKFSRGIFFKLHAYAVVLHRSILSLCDNGWAQTTPVLLRSIMDVFISLLVIAEKDSEYRAFKYFYFFQMQAKEDKNISENEKTRFNNELNDGLDKLDFITQKRIKQFIKQKKFAGYWFSPEYKNPTHVLKQLTIQKSDLVFMYRTYSAAAHGGHVGTGIHLDQPDRIDITQCSNPRKAKLAVIGSCRYLLTICLLRNEFENLGLNKIYSELLKEFYGFKDVI